MTLQAVVVEDDESFLKFVTFTLARHNFHVTPMDSGRELLRHLLNHQPDIVFLDRILPDASGFALCEKVKLRYPGIMLVMFSTMGEAEDVIEGLYLGADEYLPKPFSAEMLMAKVTALMRRCKGNDGPLTLSCDELVWHKMAHRVTLAGEDLQLTKTEYQLLGLLMERQGQLVSHADILSLLGYAQSGEDMQRNIFFHMTSLRKKLGSYRKRITTVRGFGYRLLATP